jgi:hypothetical protein
MNSRIIYPTDDGGVAVIVPSPDCLQEHTIEEIAAQTADELKALLPE